MLWSCNRNLNAVQLRSMRQVSGMLAACVAITCGMRAVSDWDHLSPLIHTIASVLTVIPILGTLVIVARYLARETDEYLRSLVVRSILWAFGIVMVTDTIIGSIAQYYPLRLPLGMLNMDIFVVTGMLALRLQLRSSE
jgi:ABC-type proline/glycine betaine transport system permease subunit